MESQTSRTHGCRLSNSWWWAPQHAWSTQPDAAVNRVTCGSHLLESRSSFQSDLKTKLFLRSSFSLATSIIHKVSVFVTIFGVSLCTNSLIFFCLKCPSSLLTLRHLNLKHSYWLIDWLHELLSVSLDSFKYSIKPYAQRPGSSHLQPPSNFFWYCWWTMILKGQLTPNFN